MKDINNDTPLIFGLIAENDWTQFDAIATSLSVIFLLPALYALKKYLDVRYKEYKYSKRKKSILKNNHIVVCGLGKNNRVYIDSEIKDKNKNIIIIEQNKDNLYLDKYKKLGLSIEIGTATDNQLLQSLNINKAKHVLVSTGKDMSNLEIATQIFQIDKNARIYIHIEDRSLRHFHKEQGLLDGSSIKIYSYYEEASRELFENFDIDGQDNSIINSNQNYSIAVVGNSNLAYEVISQACIMSQLPNENLLTIYCIDKNPKEFKQSVELNYTQIDKINTVNLKFISLDINSKDFYENELWHDNLTNIIICFEEEQINLGIASNIAEITYIDEIADNILKTNIIIAMFNDYSLGSKIQRNNTTFKNFHTFGNIYKINNKNIIINETRDTQAKCVNFVYNTVSPKLVNYELYEFSHSDIDKNKFDEINIGWNKLSYFSQESNRAVADHIKIKLKYLGFKYKKSTIKFEILHSKNKEILKSNFSQNIKNILAKNEHQRWNAFHYLNGYKRIDFLSKEEKRTFKKLHELKKLHMCLIPFKEFKVRSDELLEKGYDMGEFEGYDFMINEYIPFILAKSGYEIMIIGDIL